MQPTGEQDTHRAVLLHYNTLVLGLVNASLPLTFNKVLSVSVGNPTGVQKRGKEGLVRYLLCTVYV